MREKLVDFLRKQQGYYQEARELDGGSIVECLIRPDGTIAAEYRKDRDKWETRPIQEEMIRYEQLCGRGIPSLLGGDLTNTEIPRSRSSSLIFRRYL